jgi:hypothetical protein
MIIFIVQDFINGEWIYRRSFATRDEAEGFVIASRFQSRIITKLKS